MVFEINDSLFSEYGMSFSYGICNNSDYGSGIVDGSGYGIGDLKTGGLSDGTG